LLPCANSDTPLGEDPEIDAEIRKVDGVDDPIHSGADTLKAEGAATTVVFPLLGLLDFITATSPRVIWPVDPRPLAPTFSASALKLLLVEIGA
jgi:hypothetical protein